MLNEIHWCGKKQIMVHAANSYYYFSSKFDQISKTKTESNIKFLLTTLTTAHTLVLQLLLWCPFALLIFALISNFWQSSVVVGFCALSSTCTTCTIVSVWKKSWYFIIVRFGNITCWKLSCQNLNLLFFFIIFPKLANIFVVHVI